jgi:hypothetical protein
MIIILGMTNKNMLAKNFALKISLYLLLKLKSTWKHTAARTQNLIWVEQIKMWYLLMCISITNAHWVKNKFFINYYLPIVWLSNTMSLLTRKIYPSSD